MKEENELRKKYGAPNPFTVPEGYFENLAGKVMEQLPEKESQPQPEVTMWERVRPWVYMAAMFCGLMFGVRVMVNPSIRFPARTDIQRLSPKFRTNILIPLSTRP